MVEIIEILRQEHRMGNFRQALLASFEHNRDSAQFELLFRFSLRRRFIQRVRAMGIRDRPIPPRSPRQNGYAERLIGSIRRDCLDHVVVFGEPHLRNLLRSYQRYYQ